MWKWRKSQVGKRTLFEIISSTVHYSCLYSISIQNCWECFFVLWNLFSFELFALNIWLFCLFLIWLWWWHFQSIYFKNYSLTQFQMIWKRMRPLLVRAFLSTNCEKNVEGWPREAPQRSSTTKYRKVTFGLGLLAVVYYRCDYSISKHINKYIELKIIGRLSDSVYIPMRELLRRQLRAARN